MVQMNKSGLWKGVVHNRIGHFKFINVEILNDRVPRRGEPERGKWGQRYRQKPGSVQELLQRMNLQVESNISPRLEQTDSHLHAVECKVERTCFYTFLYSASLSRRLPPSPPFVPPLSTIVRIGFPTYTLYNSQVPRTMTIPFCSTPLPIRLFLPPLPPFIALCLHLAHFYPHLHLYILFLPLPSLSIVHSPFDSPPTLGLYGALRGH